MRRRVRTVLAAVVAAGAVACTDGGTGRATAAAPGTFSVAVREPASLIPARVRDLPGRLIADAVWTPLVDAVDPAHPKFLAAVEVTSTDQLTWLIRLRPGMRFHDGTPVTAQSYVDTWRTVLGERWPGAGVLSEVLRAKDFRATDEATVELTLDRPFGGVPLVLGAPALLPLPGSVLASRDWTGFAANPVGNGPYRMVGPWRPGAGARLSRFDGYVGLEQGRAREIALRVVADPGEQYELARSGEVDLATDVPGARHDQAAADFPGRLLMWPLPELTVLGFPMGNNGFADAAARHAIALAVDRAALDTGPLGHQVDPAGALLPPAVPLGRRSGPCRPCNHDPAAAKALWEQAGKPVAVLPVYFDADSGDRVWVSVLADQLRATLGVTVDSRPTPAVRYQELLAGRAFDGLFVMDSSLWTRSPREVLSVLASHAPGNATGYANAGFDQMLDAADATADIVDSGGRYRLAENQLLRDLPVVPLWSGHGHAVWTARLSNVTAGSSQAIDLARIDVPS